MSVQMLLMQCFSFNREFKREQDLALVELTERFQKNVQLLNVEQKNVDDSPMKVVDVRTGGIYFLDAPGGTGKTFVISLIVIMISEISLALESFGNAATLFEGGQTVH